MIVFLAGFSCQRGRLYPVQGEAFRHGVPDVRRHDSQQQRRARNFWHVGRDREGRNRLGAHPWVRKACRDFSEA